MIIPFHIFLPGVSFLRIGVDGRVVFSIVIPMDIDIDEVIDFMAISRDSKVMIQESF